MTRPLVRVVFALLVVATIAAFLVTQQLKSELPLVLRFATQYKTFSPNRDGVKDTTRIGFDLTETSPITFSVHDREGLEVRRIVDDRRLAGSTDPRSVRHRFSWDGTDEAGRVVPDGIYRMRVVRRDEGRVIDSIKDIRVDTSPPRATLRSARPSVIAPGEPGQRPEVRIRYYGPVNQAPEFRVFRTDDGSPRVVTRFRGDDTRSAVWDGNVRGAPAQAGDYAFTVTVRDRAGNAAVAPAEIPSRASARPGTAVSARPFTLSGPLRVISAGEIAELRVGPVERSFDFVLSRLGDLDPVRRGERIGGRLRLRVPRDARTGVYLVRVRARGRRAVWPLAVAGLPQSRRAAGRPRPLLVLPAITWQGLNDLDSDHDGFGDSLARSRRVPLDRAFRTGRPPLFSSQAAPLLDFLDRARLGYDLTTDLSLALREGPALGNAPGVAFAGSPLWLPAELQRRVRRYVDDGGVVASFGADAFRRSVQLSGDALVGASPPRPESVFGERTSPARTGLAPLSVFEDDLGLFRDVTGFVGEFTRLEVSEALPAGSSLRSAAGREAGTPAFVAFPLGEGLVVRSGTPQWARELSEKRLGVEVAQVTRRIWSLLARGPGSG